MKKRIIDVTKTLFSEKGMDKTTIADICGAAGITKKTFYYHFKSKQDIMLQYFNSFMKENPADVALKLALMSSYREKLKHLYFSTIDITGSLGPDVAKSMILTYLEDRENSGDLLSFYDINPNSDLCLELIRLGQKSGEITGSAPPEMLHRTFMFAVSGALFYWCANNGAIDDRVFLDNLFNLIFERGRPSRR